MYNPPSQVIEKSYITSLSEYEQLYKRSIKNPEDFWAEKAKEYLTWIQPFTQTKHGGFHQGDIAWFLNGKLNASANCVDRHLKEKGEKTAIIWESDEQGVGENITFNQLFQKMCKIANFMKEKGIKKGDTVTIYMPMIPELIYVILACTRIGAIHNVVFAGFSSTSLKNRIIDAESKYVFTADYGRRGGKTSLTKGIVDAAIKDLDFVRYSFVFRHPKISSSYEMPDITWNDRDIDMSTYLPFCRPYCPYEIMDSEDPLFILYTSGSTGKPKGLVHTTAGYLLYTMITSKYVFDLRPDDVYACVADAGWITGHSYVIYGPLALGNSTVMFESIPNYPDYGRYWDLVERHHITQFYTAPTAIRSLMGQSKEHVTKHNLSSLRILGSVGEPINPEAWKWYYEVVGNKKCAIVDTYWQTETGGHVGTNMPGAIPMKPGSCSFPFFGIDFVLKNEKGEVITEPDVEGRLCIAQSWPGIARTVNKDHARYLTVYTKPFPGTYFTGDACKRDKDGFYWIIGRIDDVLNTSGHRIGTAEIESALVSHECVSEAAVVGFPHKIRGEGICCFVTLRAGIEESPALKKDLGLQITRIIGPFAKPDLVVCTPNLPKTRSGKIMRRILRKIAYGEESAIGDISTLADPAAVNEVLELFKNEVKDKNI